MLVRNPKTGKEHFARVKVPPIFARFVPLGNQRFVPLEDVIGEHLKRLFPGMEVLDVHTFRVTRNEDLEVEEDDAENLLQALEKELLRRRFGPPVRLEVEESIDDHILDLLMSELGVSSGEVVRLPGPLDLRGLHDIADLDREDLKYPAFVPSTHTQLAEVESASPVDVFKALRRNDVLLHHPYDSFATSVQRFIEQAAADPQVLAIKQTLYRTSGDSPIIDALIDAAEAGKQVLVLVEIKARFDEQANIRWARKLEQAGCHVVYGLVGLKTHCKLAMVVRDEPEGIRRYAHIGTGNYNPKTARLYEDLGLLTADEAIGEDVAHLFNNLSGFSRNASYEQLLVAPDSVRDRTARADPATRSTTTRPGRPARIRIKANSIVDEAHHRRAVPRVAGRGARRPADPGHLRAAPRRARPVGEHPGALDPGPVPRAQPGLLVRERRQARGLDRLGRPDAPQPRPPRRGAWSSCPERVRSRRADRWTPPPSTPLRGGGGAAPGDWVRHHLDEDACAAARPAGEPDRDEAPAPQGPPLRPSGGDVPHLRLTLRLPLPHPTPTPTPTPRPRSIVRDGLQEMPPETPHSVPDYPRGGKEGCGRARRGPVEANLGRCSATDIDGDPASCPPDGLVRPVPVDPTGRNGPTRGQANGFRWRRTSCGLFVPAMVDAGVPEQRILEQSMRLTGGAVTGWASCRLHGAAFFDGLRRDGRTLIPVPLNCGPLHQIRRLPGGRRAARHAVRRRDHPHSGRPMHDRPAGHLRRDALRTRRPGSRRRRGHDGGRETGVPAADARVRRAAPGLDRRATGP